MDGATVTNRGPASSVGFQAGEGPVEAARPDADPHPGLFIFLTALSINLFGLWLRMVNDPTHRWRYLRDR